MKSIFYILIIVVAFLAIGVYGELRWCKLSDLSSSPAADGWVQYSDTQQRCVNCSANSVSLIDVDRLAQYECCEGILVAIGNCSHLVEDTCSYGVKCDGVKQCVNGADEVGCRTCAGTNLFSCSHDLHQAKTLNKKTCVSTNQTCDSTKDCEMGLDESGCPWHKGWCNGYLCPYPHEKCISMSQVCDGVKNCVDGSDEFHCRYCNSQFQCLTYEKNDSALTDVLTETGQCVGMFRVCDGKKDCSNNLDETNCYRWLEWSSWSSCNPPAVCSRNRTRACVDYKSKEVDAKYCYNVDDPDALGDAPSVEKHTEICPVCIPTRPASIAVETSTTLELVTDTARTSAVVGAVSSAKAIFATTTPYSLRDSEVDSSDSDVAQEAITSSIQTIYSSVNNSTAPLNGKEVAAVTFKSEVSTQTKPTNYTDKLLLNAGRLRQPNIQTSQSNIRINMTEASPTVVSSAHPPKKASIISFAIIIAASAAAAVILLLIICSLFCCISERRRRGKWVPRQRYIKNRVVTVPQMYHDVQVDTIGERKEQRTEQEGSLQTQTFSSFSCSTAVSAADSGIDDGRSTSSLEAAHHARQLSLPVVDYPTSTPRKKDAVSKSVRHSEEDTDLPPPPSPSALPI